MAGCVGVRTTDMAGGRVRKYWYVCVSQCMYTYPKRNVRKGVREWRDRDGRRKGAGGVKEGGSERGRE